MSEAHQEESLERPRGAWGSRAGAPPPRKGGAHEEFFRLAGLEIYLVTTWLWLEI